MIEWVTFWTTTYKSPQIPSGKVAIAAIKKQGGLVYLEHPYDTGRRNLREEAIERIADRIDIVEIFNGRSQPEINSRAEELRSSLGVPAGAGSDASGLMSGQKVSGGVAFFLMWGAVRPRSCAQRLRQAGELSAWT